MSENDLHKNSKNYSINSPKKCDYYKKLLVEELVLMPDLYDLHYGDCAVIGKIRKEPTGEIYLENIKTTYLEKQYLLSEGSIAIKLLDNLFNSELPNGKTVEILGKVILYDKIHFENNQIPTTSKDLYMKLLNYLNIETEKDKKKTVDNLKENFNEKLRQIYEPAIQIRSINLVDSADELIESNLQIRILCDDN